MFGKLKQCPKNKTLSVSEAMEVDTGDNGAKVEDDTIGKSKNNTKAGEDEEEDEEEEEPSPRPKPRRGRSARAASCAGGLDGLPGPQP